MKRSGFSLTEIIMLIFTIAVIAAAIFPLKLIDLHQAERIAKWKTFYAELNYSFDLMEKTDTKLIEAYKTNVSLKSDDFFKDLTMYLAVDEKQTQSIDFSKYRKRFLNGQIIRHMSKYKARQFVCLKNGMIVSFASLTRKDASQPLGILFVDVDNKIKRNFIGRDVFVVLVYPDRIEPMGYKATRQEMKEDCSPVGSGLKCSAYYLVGGSF